MILLRRADRSVFMKQVTTSELETSNYYYGHTTAVDFFEVIPTHTHSTCELLFITKGNMVYSVEGKSYPITKNSLIISRASEAHAIYPQEPTEYDRYDLIFDETTYGAELFAQIPKGIDVINLNSNELVCGLFKKMEYYCNNAEGDTLLKLLTHLTEEILFNIVLISQQQDMSSKCTANSTVLEAIEFINENITEPLLIETICEALYITKSHLHKLFMTHLNITPRNYIVTKKLRLAQSEMQAGSSPTEVAVRYGFGNYATFYRNYKSYFGVSPSHRTTVTIERKFF